MFPRARAPLLAAVLAALAAWAPSVAAEVMSLGVAAGALTTKKAPLVAILCYHDVSSAPGAPLQTVSPEFLRAQIRACRQAGWTFLPLSELLARRDQPGRLPARVMVLTFDDAYRSFLDRALPVLREEGVKATLSVITAFVDRPPADMPPLLTWDEIRRIDESGAAEIASHSHGLHRYETSDPYKDTAPSVATRRYVLAEARYENREEYRRRIGDDLLESQRVMRAQLGHEAAVLVWPYGLHNEMARGLAAQAGYSATLALGWRAVSLEDLRSGCLPRVMVTRNMKFAGSNPAWLRPPAGSVRAAQVDLDALYDPDPAVFRGRVDSLVAQVRGIGATHVFLQLCAQTRGDGTLRAAYGMNHQLPVRADVWSMVACRLAQARLRVWARVPSLNLTWVWDRHPEWRIHGDASGGGGSPWRTRLSPDLPEVRRAAIDFCTDLAVYLPIDGVLFDDDACMLADERLALSPGSDAARKAEAIDDLLEDCRGAVRAWRPECRFGRNIDAAVVEVAGVHPGLAQDYERCLRDFDLTVVMAYPWMTGHANGAGRWMGTLGRRAIQRWRAVAAAGPPGLGAGGAVPAPVLFKLQAYDWKADRWLPARSLAGLAAEVRRAGVRNLGIYPVVPDRGEIPPRFLEEGTPAEPMTGMAGEK